MNRPPIPCKSCSAQIEDGTPYWNVPPLGACCDKCWPRQALNFLREYRNPAPGDFYAKALQWHLDERDRALADIRAAATDQA